MKRIYGIAILAALFAFAAPAQDADMQKQMKEEIDTALKNMTFIRLEGGVMSNVKNAPYRADQITETNQTLGDGTRIHNEHRVTIYRDSQGRVRRELPNEISIWDPNSEASYTLNTENMTARKMHVSVSVNSWTSGGRGLTTVRTGVAVFDGGRGGENVPLVLTPVVPDGSSTASFAVDSQTVTVTMPQKKEILGTQVMEGVSARGERQTRTIEAGDFGNDRPIQIVSERWYSPDLDLDVMTRHSDPRTGEETMRLTNINRAEPDASLFVVPPGYTVVEGPGGRGARGGRQ
jgi:hypothetical protein